MSLKTSHIIFTSSLILILGACAHHRDVRPGAQGIHRVVVSTDDSDAGSREAIAQANHFCKERGLTPAFVEEAANYKGDMDEKDYKNAKKATTAAKALGGAAYVFGGEKESSLGGIVGLGGAVGDSVLGKGYSVEMKFKCL